MVDGMAGPLGPSDVKYLQLEQDALEQGLLLC